MPGQALERYRPKRIDPHPGVLRGDETEGLNPRTGLASIPIPVVSRPMGGDDSQKLLQTSGSFQDHTLPKRRLPLACLVKHYWGLASRRWHSPRPERRLNGYLRIDTVHQGDQEGRKGLYHINAVDQVTQWEIVACTPQISELWLLPVLEALLAQFPFVIRGFHSDNGSEFINYNVARLLDKLLIEQTKSRAHHTGDNGLVETKNGAIIRKHIGYGHIGAQHAEAMNQFRREHLNPYANFHRPCAVPKVLTAANGKRRRIYLRWATPFEMFRELPGCEKHLRPHITLAELDRCVQAQSDTEAALAMQRAKRKLFQSFERERTA